MTAMHPLIEKVARAIDPNAFGDGPDGCKSKDWERHADASRRSVARKKANAAIRAVLTFEPTPRTTVALLHSDKWVDTKGPPEQRMDPMDAYRAMTAALLKEIEESSNG